MKDNTYYYSASTNSFYPIFMRADYEATDSLPADLIEVNDDIFAEFTSSKKGYKRGSNEDGYPIWIEISQQEIDEQQLQKNTAFLSSETRRTNDAIEVLDDAIEFEEATTEEIAQHKSLRKYRLDLSRVQNQETWPLNPVWPECPDFFKI